MYFPDTTPHRLCCFILFPFNFAGAAASLADGDHMKRETFGTSPFVREDKQQDSDSGLGFRHLPSPLTRA